MSPEVAQNLPYNPSADVYSFAIVLWEICTSNKPYDGISSNVLLQKVVNAKVRPKTNEISIFSSSLLSQLMKQCWSHNSNKRPNFGTIIQRLQQIRVCIDPTHYTK
jgi:Protein tyrosine and serine/threonine kinase